MNYENKKQLLEIEKELELLEEISDDDIKYDSLIQELMYDECETNLETFVINAWNYVAKTPYIDSWHISCLCDHLEALYKLDIQNLLINIAPRHGKSVVCSVIFPVWCLLQDPSFQIISASYGQKLAEFLGNKSKELIKSNWFQKRWSGKINFIKNTEQFQQTKELGHRFITSVEGAVTGYSAELALIDDPHKAKDYQSKARREAVKAFYDSSISNRWNTPETFRQMIIHQRIAVDDLTGYILESHGDKWEHITLPIEYIPTTFISKIGWQDPRTKEGELLNPKILDEDQVYTEKRKGSYVWFPQFQQQPVSNEGGYVKKSQLQYWYRLPEYYDAMVIAWDLAMGGAKQNDYCCGVVLIRKGSEKFVIDVVREKLEFPEQVNRMKLLNTKYNVANKTTIVEHKANGRAAIDSLKREIAGLLPIEPSTFGGDKETRFLATTPQFEAGNIFLPDPKFHNYPWIQPFIDEITTFPKSRHDDQVDALGYAINYLELKNTNQIMYLPTNTIANVSPHEYFNQVSENNKYNTVDITVKEIRGLFG